MLKRLFCLLVCAALLCPAALAATYDANLESWEGPNYSILFNDEGELLMLFDERYVVSRIGEKQDWFQMAVEVENSDEPKYALINAEGEQVTDRLFDCFHDATLHTVIFREGPEDDCRYGLLNADGEEILPAEYDLLEPFGDTHLFTVDESGCVVIIGEDGTQTPTPWIKGRNLSGWGGDYDDLGTYVELLPAHDPETGLAGYINPEGEWAIAPQFAKVDIFRNGHHNLATVYATGNMRKGVIDTQGNIVIPMKYSLILMDHPLYIEAAPAADDNARDFYTWDGEFVLSGGRNLVPCGQGFYDREKDVFLDSSGNEIALDDSTYEPGIFDDPYLRHKDTRDWHLLTSDFTLTEAGYVLISSGQEVDGGEVYVGYQWFDSPEPDECYGYLQYCTLLDMHGNELISFDKKILEMTDVPCSKYLVFQTETTIGVIDVYGDILLEEPLPPADDSTTE